MRKYAFILLGPDYEPEKHQVTFETEGNITCLFTVRNYEEARRKALYCAENGFGIIELCGAFGEEKAREIIELTGGRMGVGYVVHLPAQDELFDRFFTGP